jgi:hypothetical protein
MQDQDFRLPRPGGRAGRQEKGGDQKDDQQSIESGAFGKPWFQIHHLISPSLMMNRQKVVIPPQAGIQDIRKALK